MGGKGEEVAQTSGTKGSKGKLKNAAKGTKRNLKNAAKGSKGKLKKSNKKGKAEVSKKQFRSGMSGLQSIFEDYHSLIKPAHLEAMKKTPFFTFFNSMHMRFIDSTDCRRVDRVSEEIIRAFNPLTRKFKIGEKEARITRQDVRLILGIVDGERLLFDPRAGKRKEWRFCIRMFVGCDKLTQKVIKDKLSILFGREAKDERPDDVEDIVRLLCLLSFASFFFPRNGVRVSWGWVEYVERIEEMRLFDWSERILSMLVDSLVCDHTNPYQVKGCTLLPLYWLCEHTKVIEVREDVLAGGGMIPRLVKWHLPKMKDIDLGKIVGDEVQVKDLVASKHEVTWYEELYKCGGPIFDNVVWDTDEETDSESVGTADDEENYVSLEDDDSVRDSSIKVGRKDVKKGLENELVSMKQKYAELLKVHDDLEQKFGEVEEENKKLKEQVVSSGATVDVMHAVPLSFSIPMVDGVNMPYNELVDRWKAGTEDSKRKDEEIWNLREKVSALSATVEELRGDALVKVTELARANEMVAELQKKMDLSAKKRPIDLDDERWYTEIVEPIVHSVTQEYCPEIKIPSLDKKILQSSMVKRVKEKERKANKKDDDFVYINPNGKRPRVEGSSSREQSTSLSAKGFLAMLDKEKKYRGHFGHYLKAESVSAFVTMYNQGPGVTVYQTTEPLVVVTVNQVLEILRGVYVCNSVIDAYAAHLLKCYKGDRTITIISADCWTRIVKDESQNLLEQIRQATLLDKALMLFPVLCTGLSGDLGQNHWTLMVYDVHDGVWNFYNSKKSRNKNLKDMYHADAEKMKCIIEDYLDVGPKDNFDPEMHDYNAPLETVTTVPSQGPTSDCAIFTCYFMKHVVMDLPLGKKINTELVKKFKAEVVEALLPTP